MSRFSRWWKRLWRRRRRRGGSGTPVDDTPPVEVPPEPLYGELEVSSDIYSVIDTQANFVTIFVNRTKGSDKVVTCQYHTVPGTATPGVDYTPVTGTLTWFDQDQNPKPIQVPILQRAVSGDFTFDVVIDTPGGGVTIITGGDTATVTIERRGFGEADFAGPLWYVKNPDPNPATSLTLFVQRNFAFKGLVTVSWHTQDGTALAGLDYTAGSGLLTWADGDGSPKAIIIAIPPRPGGPFPDRDFFVVLDTPTGGIVIGPLNPADATVTDAAPPANPTVTASVPNQIPDDFSTDIAEILAGDDFSVVNYNILCNEGSGRNIVAAYPADLLGVSFAFATGAGVAVGTNGAIYFSSDFGALWQLAFPDVSVALRSVCMATALVGWAVGDNGTILKTTDGGHTWTPQTSGTAEHLLGVWAINTTTAWAVGANGTILKTTDGGANWVAQTSGVVVDLNSIMMVDANTGWAVGDSGTILKTTNGGTNWVAQVSGTAENLNSVWRVDANTVYAAGDNGTILKTTNGGTNWNAQTSGTAEHLRSINALDANTVVACGDNGTVLRTTNGGTNWNAQTSGTAEDLNCITHTEGGGNILVAVGDNNTILRTVNAGTNWTQVTVPDRIAGSPPAGPTGGIDFSNDDDTFAPTSRFALSGMIS